VSDEEARRRSELIEALTEDNAALTAALLQQRLDPLMSLSITFPQLKVLLLVVADPETTTHALAERLHVSAPTMSGIIDRLVEHGMVHRLEDRADRRVRRLVATEEGQRTAQTVTSVTEWHRQHVLTELTLPDLEALARGFRAVREVVERAPTRPGPDLAR